MKLVIREYLASLKERDELDAVLPDLLTELGFTVYSRPARGTRQYGVDVAAVGPGQDGILRVHLFSVKSGDLDRNEWNTASPQSLRPSLDEILDHYIATRIPPEYANLPIAICLTFGGAIDEQVRAEVTGYMTRNTTPRISFEEWNGDRLAQVILDGILREELLPAPQRSHLRKAVAMVEEPDIALNHFQRLLRAIADQAGATPAGRLSKARLINICLWIMFVWAREADNVEAPYRASELAFLEVWQLLKTDIARTSKSGEAASLILNELAELHFTIWDALFEDKILPAAEIRHAISTAVESHAALDINLKLFDLIGRLALRGLWLVWQLSPATGPVMLTNDYLNTLPALISDTTRATVNQIDRLIEAMMAIVSNNRVLLSPIGDWQAIDIGLAFTLLACRPGAHGAIDQWAEELAKHSMFAFKAHGRYPITSRSYWDLVDHPSERSDAYRTASTEGSILYPLLAIWAAARGEQMLFDEIAKFSEDALAHCTFQTWLPDEDSEDNLYLNRDSHGAALAGIPVTEGTRDSLDFILAEAKTNKHYDQLTAVKLGHWPIVLTACRAHRLPVPPQVWRDLLPHVSRPARGPVPPPDDGVKMVNDDGKGDEWVARRDFPAARARLLVDEEQDAVTRRLVAQILTAKLNFERRFELLDREAIRHLDLDRQVDTAMPARQRDVGFLFIREMGLALYGIGFLAPLLELGRDPSLDRVLVSQSLQRIALRELAVKKIVLDRLEPAPRHQLQIYHLRQRRLPSEPDISRSIAPTVAARLLQRHSRHNVGR